MGIMVGLPSPSGSEKDLQLIFGKNMIDADAVNQYMDKNGFTVS